MIARSTGKNKMDNLLIIDGDEGYGKTNMSVGLGYYFSYVTGRPFSVKNIFFSAEKLVDFAKRTEDQIIIYDESALSAMGMDWWKKEQQDLIKLLMVARKKRHFFIFNIPKFFKLNEYLIVDRSIGMIHVYARNELEIGRWVYFPKKKKELLFYNYKRKRTRGYKKFYTMRGTFPYVLPKLIDEKAYDKMKDDAILSIGEVKAKKNHPDKIKLNEFKLKVGKLRCPILTREELAVKMETTNKTLCKWQKITPNGSIGHPSDFNPDPVTDIVSNRESVVINPPTLAEKDNNNIPTNLAPIMNNYYKNMMKDVII